MQYSISYTPRRNRQKPWLLKVWEPVSSSASAEKNSYLYQAQYWLQSQAEAKDKLLECQQMWTLAMTHAS